MGCSSSKSADVIKSQPPVKEKKESTPIKLEEEGYQWYFSYDLLMNHVTLNNRGIFPKDSVAGEVQDYELVFIGPSGSPAAKSVKDSKLHGVLHKCNEEEMEEFDIIG